jgi:hypothetical protein
MPPATIQDALKKMGPQFNLGTALPEIIKHLVAGAISAPKQPADDDDEELEDDEEPDVDEE